MPTVEKTFVKTITIQNKFSYRLLNVTAGTQEWLEAEPIGSGITRTAENERVLRIILENDALNANRQQPRVR